MNQYHFQMFPYEILLGMTLHGMSDGLAHLFTPKVNYIDDVVCVIRMD